jgi:outer membrane protein OmpA-like peptidoglycan-associated protein
MKHPVLGYRSRIALALVFTLAGCSSQLVAPVAPSSFTLRQDEPKPEKRPPSYVVLLPSPDGTVGRVIVTGQRGQQVLTQAQQGTWLDGSGTAFSLTQSVIDRDFNAALAARPPIPEHFLIYFEVGGTILTKESQAVLKQLIERARSFPTLDISVVGHTDTLGKSEINEVLALNRAKFIAGELQRLDVKNMAIAVESQGERNLLVPTPDETREQKNRRVAVTLR